MLTTEETACTGPLSFDAASLQVARSCRRRWPWSRVDYVRLKVLSDRELHARPRNKSSTLLSAEAFTLRALTRISAAGQPITFMLNDRKYS